MAGIVRPLCLPLLPVPATPHLALWGLSGLLPVSPPDHLPQGLGTCQPCLNALPQTRNSLGQSSRPTAGNLRPREQEPVRVRDSAGHVLAGCPGKHMTDAMVPVPTGGLLGLRRAWLAARGVLGANCLRRVHHPCRDLWSVMSPPLAWDGGGMGVGRGKGRRTANSQRLHCHRTKETLRPESSADPSETGPAAGSPPPWPGGQTGGLVCG